MPLDWGFIDHSFSVLDPTSVNHQTDFGILSQNHYNFIILSSVLYLNKNKLDFELLRMIVISAHSVTFYTYLYTRIRTLKIICMYSHWSKYPTE